jgi:NAD(P)-dependent dehydrogenase (short-subunit alcohol dehydrogenase family)
MSTVLVTGASRGIGRVTALRLSRAGWDVYASVRKDEDGKSLVEDAPERINPVRLDVTSAADVAALPERLPERLDGVVNNAGYAAGGPVEGLPLDEWRRQFEVNLFGQVAVTQAVLPKLRAARGRVVFVSSVSGRIATPLMGPYVASKFALEAMADALRVELRPWRIPVTLVEPGNTDTALWQEANHTLDSIVETLSPESRTMYRRHIDGMRKLIPVMQRTAVDPEGVAAVIERALTASRPRPRYVVGTATKAQLWMARMSPTPVRDAALARAMRLSR